MNYKVKSAADIKDDLMGYTIVSASLGASGEICILGVNEVPEKIDGMFPPVQTETTLNYKAVIEGKGYRQVVELKNQKWNYHYIQLIDENNILLACARAKLYKDGKFDLNAKVFDLGGNLVREFLLGDGIQDIFVTNKNKIWTSYFDEGVIGNFGWNTPIGRFGLRSWNSDGKECFLYPNYGLHFIVDCYALNVAAEEEVWFYFYTEFELGRYSKGRLDYFQPDVKGSDGFIVFDNYFLFRGGYDDQDQYILCKMGPRNKLTKIMNITLADEENTILSPHHISCRGYEMLLVKDKKAYVLNLKEFLQERGLL